MPPLAPWAPTLKSHLSSSPTPEFALTTIALDAKGQSVPRTRTVGFRGWFPNPELHSSALKALEAQNESPNPAVYESEMISFTTDVRMEKIAQLEGSGGVVEGVFWVKDVGSQWRVRGEAFVFGDPEATEREQKAREEIRKGLRVCEGCEGKEKEWSWERVVTTYFANHTPVLRGWFLSSLVDWGKAEADVYRLVQESSAWDAEIAGAH
jgi:pyridoxamine 5'-phosphate oxidase